MELTKMSEITSEVMRCDDYKILQGCNSLLPVVSVDNSDLMKLVQSDICDTTNPHLQA